MDLRDTTPTDATLIPGEPLVDVDPSIGVDPSAAIAAPPVEAGGQPDGPGKASLVKDAATSAVGDAASTAGEQAKNVASEAASQARSVVDEVKGQAGDLAGQTRDQLREQAEARSANAAASLNTLSERMQALVDGRPGDAGPLADYLGEARDQVSTFASRLESGGFDGAVADISDFARRRPGMFIVATAGAGFLIGRLVRGARAANGSGPNTGVIDTGNASANGEPPTAINAPVARGDAGVSPQPAGSRLP